jgi:hypothetical protein
LFWLNRKVTSAHVHLRSVVITVHWRKNSCAEAEVPPVPKSGSVRWLRSERQTSYNEAKGQLHRQQVPPGRFFLILVDVTIGLKVLR